jgi:hypothetical protein
MPDTNATNRTSFKQRAMAERLQEQRARKYPYAVDPGPRDHTDSSKDLLRDLADIAAQIATLKGEANAWLSDESYDALSQRLENAHAAVERAAVEARRRVRLNKGHER